MGNNWDQFHARLTQFPDLSFGRDIGCTAMSLLIESAALWGSKGQAYFAYCTSDVVPFHCVFIAYSPTQLAS